MLAILLLLAAQAGPDPSLPDPNGLQTEAQAKAQAAALHKRMDANGDGYVTPGEMADFITRRMNGLKMPGTDSAHPLPPLSAALFAAGDTDHDGRLSLAEAVAGAAREFALTDSNHDGVVTPVERMAFLEREMQTGQTADGAKLGR